MLINVVGGGPSGLYFALLSKKRMPDAAVVVHEQNPRSATYGFGIVLADRGLDRLRRADSPSHDAIKAAMFVTQNRLMTIRGEPIFVEGGGYGGAIERLALLDILSSHCERAGVDIRYESRVDDPALLDADLVVGSDGVNSAIRDNRAEQFGTTSWQLGAKLAWYGTTRHFHYPILSFKSHARGHFWCAAYPYTDNVSTFVPECDAETWAKSGLAEMSLPEQKALVEEIFAEELQGHPLIVNKSDWHSLSVVRNKQWSVGNIVLIGDALHSAHPSIGSGTRIAMEDSIALSNALEAAGRNIPNALRLFRLSREPEKQKLVAAAEKSFMWYETVGPRIDALEPIDFVFNFMTRTGRITETRLRSEYPEFMRRYAKQWTRFVERGGGHDMPPPAAPENVPRVALVNDKSSQRSTAIGG